MKIIRTTDGKRYRVIRGEKQKKDIVLYLREIEERGKKVGDNHAITKSR